MTTAELEWELEDAAEAMASPPRGQAGRFPARRFRSHLRRQGFLVTRHFLDRLIERAQAQGIRFNPRTFAQDFRAAPHFRQTRPGYNTRIAVIQGMPVLYRMSGQRGLNPLLVGLLPQGALPPAVSTPAPLLRESEFEQQLEAAFRDIAAQRQMPTPATHLECERAFPSSSAAELENAAADLASELAANESGAENIFGRWRRRKRTAPPSGPRSRQPRVERRSRLGTVYRDLPSRQQVIANARDAAARLRTARARFATTRQQLNQAEGAMDDELRRSFGDFRQIDPAIRDALIRSRQEFQAADVELRAAQYSFNNAMRQRSAKRWQG